MYRCVSPFTVDGEKFTELTRVSADHSILLSRPRHFVRDDRGPDGTERDTSGFDGSEIRMTASDGTVVSGTDRYQRDWKAAAARRAKRNIDAAERARARSRSSTAASKPQPSWRLPKHKSATRRGQGSLEEVEFNPRAQPEFTLKLSRSARRSMVNQIQRGDPTLEVGGGLYTGEIRGNVITISDTTGPGPGAKLRSSSMRPDWDHYEDHEEWLQWQFESNARLCGLWHSHPGLPHKQSHWPSPRDRHVFANMGTQIRGQRFVALIVTPRITRNAHFEPVISWSRPRFSGWITWRDRSGVAHCEPASVIEA